MSAIPGRTLKVAATPYVPVPERCLTEKLPKVLLTDVSLRALTAPARGQVTLWDKISPLGIRVSSGGAKTFIVMVGSGRRQTIGKAGVLTLAEARTEAKRVLAEKTLGLTVKPAAPTINFDTAVALFVEENYRGKKPRTKTEAKRLLQSHFVPAFRKKSLSAITDRDISDQLAKLAHVPSEQLHAFRAIRTMLRWCTKPPRRYIAHSPLEGYGEPSQDRKGTRILTDAELVKVWRACGGLFGSMVRLLILWGTRNGETGRLQRTWIEDGVLTIPGQFTKNGRAHAIPVLEMSRTILKEQPTKGAYFFPDRWEGESHFNDGSWGKFKKALDKASGVKGWQLRDLRRTFRSNMAKLRVPREICELLLNHVTGANKSDLDEIYDKYDYLDEKREALGKWEAYLSDLLAR
jgi:Arm DNA-binding domain